LICDVLNHEDEGDKGPCWARESTDRLVKVTRYDPDMCSASSPWFKTYKELKNSGVSCFPPSSEEEKHMQSFRDIGIDL
jgi:hypothetical protein